MSISAKAALIPSENSTTTVNSRQVLCALRTGCVAEVSVADGAFAEKSTADFISLWSYATAPMRPDPVDARRAVLMWDCDQATLLKNVAAIKWLLGNCVESAKETPVISPVGERKRIFSFFKHSKKKNLKYVV